VIRIPVQLHGETPITGAFNHEVDAIAPDLNLWAQSVAKFQQPRADLALERRVAKIEHISLLRDRSVAHRVAEVLKDRRLEILGLASTM
jgi:hypothetical protein